MSALTFADVVFPHLSFPEDTPSFCLLKRVVDSRWFQRLRDIQQTANTRLVYMFSEHSRFGHSIGVAYLADLTMRSLLSSPRVSAAHKQEIAKLRAPILFAALLHDLGHLAPGSHIAFKAWFPESPDSHEEMGIRILQDQNGLRAEVPEFSSELSSTVGKILCKDPELPPWTWELISGGGWNTDRGNWCVADSVMAGVSYGKYNVNAIVESILLTEDGHLALRENRLDAMMHFSVSRHAMYRQLYQHRVLLAADTLSVSLVKRARALLREGELLAFCDSTMRRALTTALPEDLPLATVFEMREGWWRYHLMRWLSGKDQILADLSDRLLHRRLLKTIRLPLAVTEEALREVKSTTSALGYDPEYYVHEVSTVGTHRGEAETAMKVLCEDGRTRELKELDPLFSALEETRTMKWLAVPPEVKDKLVGKFHTPGS